MDKKCKKCKEIKPIDRFSKSKRNKDGLHWRCKDCDKQWRIENRDSVLKQNERYKKMYAENEELRNKAKERVYRARREKYNTPEYLEKKRKQKEKKDEFLKAKRKRDEINKWKRENTYKFIKNYRTFIWNIFKNKRMSNSKYKFKQHLGCDYETFINHIESQFVDGMSLDNKGEWETDHIIPLASALSMERLYELCHYTNIQPLWKKENRDKRDKKLKVSNLHFKK